MRVVRKQMAFQEYERSFVSSVYDKAGGKLSAEEEEIAKYTAASMYAGGADTASGHVPCSFETMANQCYRL